MIEELKKGILEEVPQIPLIIDQVSEAIDWCIEEQPEDELVCVLRAGLDVAKFLKKISDPNFYKTHILIASLLVCLPNKAEDSERFRIFESASGSVRKALEELRVPKEEIDKRGGFNALTVKLATLGRTNQDYLGVSFYSILETLKLMVEGMKEGKVKSPITPQDYIMTLGYAYVLANLRMSGIELRDDVRAIMNEIEIILAQDLVY